LKFNTFSILSIPRGNLVYCKFIFSIFAVHVRYRGDLKLVPLIHKLKCFANSCNMQMNYRYFYIEPTSMSITKSKIRNYKKHIASASNGDCLYFFKVYKKIQQSDRIPSVAPKSMKSKNFPAPTFSASSHSERRIRFCGGKLLVSFPVQSVGKTVL